MKKFLLILCAAVLLLFAGCEKQLQPTQSIPNEEIAEFVGTRSVETPLEGTIWEFNTGEKYNRYITFDDKTVSLFYGLVENGELQRWSDFYKSLYTLENGVINTNIEYPLWGVLEYTRKTNVIRKGDGLMIDVDGELFHFYGTNLDEIEGCWMIIHVYVTPWTM